MEAIKRIDQFGVYAVYGRPYLYEREMRQMIVAQNVVNAYRDRARSQSWDAWVKDNPDAADLLFKAQRLYDVTS